MREYIEQLENEYNEKIKKLKQEMQNKILEKIKDYWSPGDRVRYEDRNGVIEGKFIGIDNIGKVAVMVDRVNNVTFEGHIQLFNYKELL